MNYGFQAPEIVPEDFVFGSNQLRGELLKPNADWRDKLPLFEYQRRGVETNSCVTFGTLSALEMLYKLQYSVEPNYSDRFTSKLSGTTPTGNNPKNVIQSIRHDGTIKESEWAFTDDIKTLEEYFAEIPEYLRNRGLKWLKTHEVGYEWVFTSGKPEDKAVLLKEALKLSPIGVSVFAWYSYKDIYKKTGPDNHWVVLVAYDGDYPIVFDTYDTQLKKLEKNYDFGFAMRYSIKQVVKPHTNWVVDLFRRLLSIFR